MPDVEERLENLEIVIGLQVETIASKTALDLNLTIQTLKLSGMSNDRIKKLLLADLKDGGVIFGTYRNAIKNTTGNAVQMASTEASRNVFESRNVKEYMWVTGGGNTCPDCLPRHGQKATYEQWEISGLPRSGFSVCKHHCGCTLVPSGYKGEKLDKALFRTERIKELRKKYA